MVMLGVFIGGHFMHFTANSVNTYAYEVRGYEVGSDIPGDVALLLYLLDEVFESSGDVYEFVRDDCLICVDGVQRVAV